MRGIQLGRGPWLAGLAFIGFALSSLGCANQVESRCPGFATQRVSLLVAENFLSGKPWSLGLPREHEQRALLQAEYSFKYGDGDYSILGLCKEITRATGKRVEWLPDDRNALKAIDRYWGQSVSMPPPKVSTEEDRMSFAAYKSISLGIVLEHLLSMSTYAALEAESANRGYWTAWVGEDAIFLILLPEGDKASETLQPHETSGCAIKQVQEGGLVPGLRRAAIALPIDDFDKPWLPDVLSPPAQEAELHRTIELKEGKYSLMAFAEEIARASAKELQWRPYSCEAPGRAQQLVKATSLINVASPNVQAKGWDLESRVELHEALGALLAVATEIGLGRESPDREVWTAILGKDAIFLIMLPDAF